MLEFTPGSDPFTWRTYTSIIQIVVLTQATQTGKFNMGLDQRFFISDSHRGLTKRYAWVFSSPSYASGSTCLGNGLHPVVFRSCDSSKLQSWAIRLFGYYNTSGAISLLLLTCTPRHNIHDSFPYDLTHESPCFCRTPRTSMESYLNALSLLVLTVNTLDCRCLPC